LKTLKLSFEDAALEAFEAYAASVKMSPAEILGEFTKNRDLSLSLRRPKVRVESNWDLKVSTSPCGQNAPS